MENQALFVDFMYAVTVGAALPRLDEKALDVRSPLLWGLVFMLVVFLEDFYLYHSAVLPNLSGRTTARSFIFAMLIIANWYLSQASFPSKPRLFLVTFALFFLLKLLGGVLMAGTSYPSIRDWLFLLPIAASIALFFVSRCTLFASHPGRLLWVLAPIWFLSVILWWNCGKAPSGAKPETPVQQQVVPPSAGQAGLAH